jgi:hypothetical protein
MRGCLLLLDITEVTMHRKPHPHSYRRVIPLPGMNRHPTKSYTSQLVCRFLGSQSTSPKLLTKRSSRTRREGVMDCTRASSALKHTMCVVKTKVLLKQRIGFVITVCSFMLSTVLELLLSHLLVIYIRPSFIVLSSNYPDIDTVILSAVC